MSSPSDFCIGCINDEYPEGLLKELTAAKTQIEDLQLRIRVFESLETKRMEDAATIMDKMPELTVVASGSSGIEIRAMLGVAHNCAEFTLRGDVPQAVFISPWMQFEPAAMNDQRLKIAHEIVRRALAHDELIKQVAKLQANLEDHRDALDRKDTTLKTAYRMWREDRARAGFPADFGDIKEWPPEMMSGWRCCSDGFNTRVGELKDQLTAEREVLLAEQALSDKLEKALKVAKAFCDGLTAEECPDTVALPISAALAEVAHIRSQGSQPATSSPKENEV